jgi:protein TonB
MIITMRPPEGRRDARPWKDREAVRRWGLALGMTLWLQTSVVALLSLAGVLLQADTPPAFEHVAQPVRVAMRSLQAVRPVPAVPPQTRDAERVLPAPEPSVLPVAAATVAGEQGPVAAPSLDVVAAAATLDNLDEGAVLPPGAVSTEAPVVAPDNPLTDADTPLTAREAEHPYFEQLDRWLTRHKTYPAAMKKAGHQGVVMIRFTMDRAGRLLALQVVAGSGQTGLDEAALAMFRQAAPLPPLPPELPLPQLTLTLPVEFSLPVR